MAQLASDSGDRPGRPRWVGLTQLVLILVAIAIALYFARAPDRVARDASPGLTGERARPAVNVVKPAPTAQALSVKLTGSVRLEEKTRVVSEVVGRVVWVSPEFSNGGSISANETFIRIDPAEYELQVQAAESSVREAEARLWMEEARGEEDAREFQRANPGAEASDLIRRRPSIERAQAELERERAALELARLELARTEISLPYDGRVVSSDVEVGELVGPAEEVGRSSRLGVVYRTGALEVDAPIEPRDLAYLAPVIGRSARIHTRGGVFDGKVVRVSAVVAPKTRLASLFLKFSGILPQGSLPLPGTFAEVVIAGPSYEDVYMLPESAVQEGNSVWVVRDGVLNTFAPRSLGRTEDGWVVEAFDAGDGVVVGSLPGARDGLEVMVVDAKSSG